MSVISKDYTVFWELDFAPQYKWTKCGKCFNFKTGRELNQVYKNGSIGYNIKGKFKSLHQLKKHLIKITQEEMPF